MALINCPECGREISDKANACIHCGCPIKQLEKNEFITTCNEETVNDIESYSKKSNKKRIKPWIIVLIIIGVIIATLFIVILIIGATVSLEVDKTKENITPYLEYIGEYVPNGEYLDVGDELHEKKSNINFMGMNGHISYDVKENYVYECRWVSDEDFKEEEYQKKIDDIYLYFGGEPTFTTIGYHTGDTYIYYWTDSNNGFSVTCSRLFSMYDSPGYIEIKWEANIEDFDNFQETPNVGSDKTDHKRAEANDYDEFKYAVEECLKYVPKCNLSLKYTDDSDSYSINVGNEIVGILGTKIDTWDAVALTDPDKDDAQLHHEQISIALIMACDSDVTYEDAKKIFDEASIEDSANISAGIYFFEGVVNDMYAGSVDITWLGSSF